MQLTLESLKNDSQWFKSNFTLPKFSIDEVIAKTKSNPIWLHFGAGNIFRAFPAVLQQKLLEQGLSSQGIIVAEGYDYEIIDVAFKKYDNLSLSVVLKSDGNMEKTVVASVVESLTTKTSSEDCIRLKEIFSSPSLQLVTFTITEKGYSLEREGKITTDVYKDFEEGPDFSRTFLGKLTSFLFERFKAGAYPLSLVSQDNCSHNGDKLKSAVMSYINAWYENKFVSKEFVDYVNSSKKIAFPWTMIDKITPRPDENIAKQLTADSLENMDIIVTKKHTYIAPFVNAEEPGYLVIEDDFPNGRPKLEKVGVIFTDRETVDRVEKMKVCTCLNPLHTALGIFSNMLGYTSVSEAMKDKDLRKLLEKIGYDEGFKVVNDPKVINPKNFIDEVLNERFTNPYVPDTPQRLCVDISQGLSIRFGETIKAYMNDSNLNAESLVFIPLTLAGWCRYLLAIDDENNKMELSSDPILSEVRPLLSQIKIGEKQNYFDGLHKILENTSIFGVNLYDAKLGHKIEKYFSELIAGKKAVRNTLQKYLA